LQIRNTLTTDHLI